MATNRGTRHNPKYCGQVSYKGHKKWIGTYTTSEAYNKAREERLVELREEVDGKGRRDVPTVIEFAEVTIRDDGRIEMIWPEGQPAQKDEGRRPSTVQRMREGLKPFIREFGERQLNSFTRDEALTWARGKGSHTRQAVGQLFSHAFDRELIPINHFKRLGGSKRKRRIDRPDFEILSDEQYDRLLRCARTSRADDYGLIIEGAILAVGEAALRPGEIFALHRDEIDYEKGEVEIRWNLSAVTGKREWPKDDEPRWVPLSPRLLSHLPKMPVLSEILFPAPRGGYMSNANWSKHWHSVRAAAGMPGQEFYELKHRAIQWMVDPVEDGGLGLDAATAALIVGHDDGGYLISTTYTKLSKKRARERTRRALAEYEERRAAETPRLHVVGGS
jgi:integrase